MFEYDRITWFEELATCELMDRHNGYIDTYHRIVCEFDFLQQTREKIRLQSNEFLRQSKMEEFNRCQDARDVVEKEIKEVKQRLEQYEHRVKTVFSGHKPCSADDPTMGDPYCY